MKFYKWIEIIQKCLVLSSLIIWCIFINRCDKKNHHEKINKVGIVSGAEPFVTIVDGFKAKMTELGYEEGKNVIYDLQKLNADPEGEKRVVKRFVDDKVDIIFAFPTEPAVAAKEATLGTNIPVVFAMAGVEGTELVETVHHPGGNITGVRFPGPEATVKRLEMLCELVSYAKRILIIYDPNYPIAPYTLAQLRPAASLIGVRLIEDPVINLEELRAHLKKRTALADIGVEAILIMPDILTNIPEGHRAIFEFAEKHKVPIGGSMAFSVDLGALFSFVPDNIEMGKQSAVLVDKILKGEPAGSLMVITPNSYLTLNYKVIQELGLVVNEGLLSTAKEIIR